MRTAIVGAGAIGAGFLYPALSPNFDVDVYDLEELHRTIDVQNLKWEGEELGYHFNQICIDDFPQTDYDFVFVAVGCSNFPGVIKYLGWMNSGIVVCCDNLCDPAGYAREMLPDSPCVFVNGYPWVSCFRTDGGFLCEDGYLSVSTVAYEEGLADVPKIVPYLDDRDEWETRLVIHCGTHAVVAYNGWADGCATIPEAIRARDYGPIWDALKESFPECEGLVDKERERFEDERFPDPVVRVARNPHRKLMARERLPRLWQYVSPINHEARALVRDGIVNAVRYGRLHDPVVMMWRQLLSEKATINRYCGLEHF